MAGRPDRYRHLLAPGRIGALELRNRIAMSPMGSNLAEGDGTIGERILRYYEARARGGVGLVIVETSAVAYPRGATGAHEIGVSDDRFLPGLRRLTDAIHAHGARAALQLTHHGKVAKLDTAQGRPLLMPSAPRFRGAGDLLAGCTPDEIDAILGGPSPPRPSIRIASVEDVAEVIRDFAAAARRAQRAGFDAVEIHGGHGYLFSEFLSPAFNQRDDDFGGPVENRARPLCDAVRAVKAAVGGDFPVWVRLDSVEYRTEGGIVLDDALRTAELLEQAGVDALHASAYADATSGVAFTEAPLVHEEERYVPFAAAFKGRVSVPVIAVGRIEPERADRLIAEGRADFVAMGRKLLADPELPRKLEEGREAALRPCIYCYTCVGEIFFDRSAYCAVNPATGHEFEIATEPAETARNILVVGAGPAGMQTARVAAERGHHVVVCDARERVGGALRASAALNPPNGHLVRWLSDELDRLGVEVRTGTTVTREVVATHGPDVVVIAVGALRSGLDVPGAELPHVVTREAVEQGIETFGAHNVVVGGGLVGCEIAGWLVESGRSVTVVEAAPHLALEMALPRRWRVLHGLRSRGVALHTDSVVERIESDRVVVRSEGSPPFEITADSVVLAVDGARNDALTAQLSASGVAVHAVGDCHGAGYVEGALHDGFALGCRL